MDSPARLPTRTLVAVVASNAEHSAHTLYFSDGTVVGYDPTLARVLRVHHLPDDLGEPQEATLDTIRRTPALGLAAHIDRRREERE